MDAEQPTVLQTGPETYEIWVAGRRVAARLPHELRRGLGLQGVPPVEVAKELVRFLCEREAWPPPGYDRTAPAGPVELGRAVGRFPEFTEELRARLG